MSNPRMLHTATANVSWRRQPFNGLLGIYESWPDEWEWRMQ